MKTYGYPQLSDEWFSIRCGIPTASSADKILTPTGKLSAQSETYLNQLLADRAGYGDPPMEPTEWMQRGIDLEPEARSLFEFEMGLTVEQVGFITNEEGTEQGTMTKHKSHGRRRKTLVFVPPVKKKNS